MRALARVRTNLISKFSPCGASLNYPTHPPLLNKIGSPAYAIALLHEFEKVNALELKIS